MMALEEKFDLQLDEEGAHQLAATARAAVCLTTDLPLSVCWRGGHGSCLLHA